MENLTCHYIILDITILIVSILIIFLLFFLVTNGMPIMHHTPKNLDSKDKNKDVQNENNEEENKKFQTVLVRAPIFFNPMIKPQKGFYGKYPKKKQGLSLKGQGIGFAKI